MSSEQGAQVDFEQPFEMGDWLIQPGLNQIQYLNKGESTPNSNGFLTHKLPPKVMALCIYLAKNARVPVSQDDIASNVWPERVISDSSIYQAIAQLRKALKTTGNDVEYIERISGKGYRLLVSIRQTKPKATTSSSETASDVKPASREKKLTKWQFLSIFIAIIVSVITYFFYVNNKPVVETTIERSVVILPTNNLSLPKIDHLDSFSQRLLEKLVLSSDTKFIYARDKSALISADYELVSTTHTYENQLLLSLQLVTYEHKQVVWAKTIEMPLEDIMELTNKATAEFLHYLHPQQKNQLTAQANTSDRYYKSYVLARHLWDKRKPQALKQAAEIYQTILQESPDHIQSLVGLCHTYLYLSLYSDLQEQLAYDKCQPLINQAYNIDSNNSSVLATLAILATKQGDEIKAEGLLQRALRLTPNYAMGHMWHGNLLRQRGMYQAALESHKKAYELDPLSPIIIRDLAYSYLNLRQVNKARTFYERALLIEPTYTQRPLEELDFFPLNRSRASAYLDWLKYSTSNLSKQPASKLTQALVRLGLGEIQIAHKLIGEITNNEINPGFLLYTRAAAAFASGDVDESAKLLQTRLNLAPDIPKYAMPYISALQQQGQYASALSKFEQYFPDISLSGTVSENNVNQFIYLGQLYKTLAKNEETQRLINKIEAFLVESNMQLPKIELIFWLSLNGKNVELKQAIDQLLKAGWLPDYNDSIFAEQNMQQLYLSSGGSQYDWQQRLSKNRKIE